MRRDASTHPGYDRATVERVLDAMLACVARVRGMAVIGLSGLQGSGKSTLAAQLAGAARERGIAIDVMSLDDFYLGRRDRKTLARDVDPLFATRGVPGTHDISLLERTLHALRHASPRSPAHVPRFDKGSDTRVVPSKWRRVTKAPRLVILEGWCVGVGAESTRALAHPVNALERDEDRDGRWRRFVNDALAGEYAKLWKTLDALAVLAAPSFDVVRRWRGEAERVERKRRGATHAMSDAAIRRFVMFYERISRHALRTLPARADIVIALDAKRNVRAIRARNQARGSTTTAVP